MKLKGGHDPNKPLKPVEQPVTNEELTRELLDRAVLSIDDEREALRREIDLQDDRNDLTKAQAGQETNRSKRTVLIWTTIGALAGLATYLARCA